MVNTSVTENVYRCDVCHRNVRVPINQYGIDITGPCIITDACLGRLHVVRNNKEKNNTPAITPAVAGLQDWFPRKILATHTQGIARSSWTFEHDLGTDPLVDVLVYRTDAAGKPLLVPLSGEMYTKITNDLNNITLLFTRAESGIVQCIGTASANTINPITVKVDVPVDKVITNAGQITIATLDSSTDVNVVVTFVGTTISTSTYTVGIGSSTLSGWSDVHTIHIGGKNYTVRTFNLLTDGTGPTAFASGLIANGTPLFIQIDGINVPGTNFVLLANSPYSTIDIITDQVIDLSSISQTRPQFYYDGGNIFTSTDIVKDIYPPVILVD